MFKGSNQSELQPARALVSVGGVMLRLARGAVPRVGSAILEL